MITPAYDWAAIKEIRDREWERKCAIERISHWIAEFILENKRMPNDKEAEEAVKMLAGWDDGK